MRFLRALAVALIIWFIIPGLVSGTATPYLEEFDGTAGTKVAGWLDAVDNADFNAWLTYAANPSHARLTRTAQSTWGKALSPALVVTVGDVKDYDILEIKIDGISPNVTWKLGLQEIGNQWRHWTLQESSSATGTLTFNYSTSAQWTPGTYTFAVELIVEGAQGEYIELDHVRVESGTGPVVTATPTPQPTLTPTPSPTATSVSGDPWQLLGGSIKQPGMGLDKPVVCLGNQTPYVIFGQDMFARVKHWDGSQWIYDGCPSGTNYSINPDVKAASDGTLYAAWRENNTFGLHVSSLSGSGWVPVGGILNQNANGEAENPKLALSGATLYAAWQEYLMPSGPSEIYVKKYDGSDWVLVGEALNPNPPSNDLLPGIAVAEDGTPFVAYLEGSNLYVKKFAGGAWVPVGTPLLDSGQTTVNFPRIAVESGIPYVFYATGDNACHVKYWNGSTWAVLGSDPINLVAGAAARADAISVSNGRVYVSFSEMSGSVSQVHVKCCDQGTWSTYGGSLNVNPAVSASMSNLTVAGGRLYAVWAEGLDGYVKTMTEVSPAPTLTPTPDFTQTHTPIVTATPTFTATSTSTSTSTNTLTATPTITPTATPTAIVTPPADAPTYWQELFEGGVAGQQPSGWLDETDDPTFHAEIAYSCKPSLAAVTRTAEDVWGKAMSPLLSGQNAYPVAEVSVATVSPDLTWKLGLREIGGGYNFWLLQSSTNQTGTFAYNLAEATGGGAGGPLNYRLEFITEGAAGQYAELDGMRVYRQDSPLWVADGNTGTGSGYGCLVNGAWVSYPATFKKSPNGSVWSARLVPWNGVTYLIWTEDLNVYVDYFNGSAWMPMGGPLNDGGTWAYLPTLAVSSLGVPYIGFRENSSVNTGDYQVLIKRWDGNSWVAVGGSIHAISADVKLDGEIPYVVSMDWVSGVGNQFSVRHLNNGDWVADGPVTSGSVNPAAWCIFNHRPYVTASTASQDSVAAFDGTHWVQAISLSRENPNQPCQGVVMASRQDKLFVAWISSTVHAWLPAVHCLSYDGSTSQALPDYPVYVTPNLVMEAAADKCYLGNIGSGNIGVWHLNAPGGTPQPTPVAWQDHFTGTPGALPAGWMDDSNNSGFNALLTYANTPSQATIARTATDTWGKVLSPLQSLNVNTYPMVEVKIDGISSQAAWKLGIQEIGGSWNHWTLQNSSAQTGVFNFNYQEITGWNVTHDFRVEIIVESAVPGEHVDLDYVKVCQAGGVQGAAVVGNWLQHKEEHIATRTPTLTPTQVAHAAFSPTATPTLVMTATCTPTPTPWLSPREVQVYPNPARGRVRFAYTLAGPGRVVINVYHLNGERVARIVEDKDGGAGQTLVTTWEAAGVAPGIYFCRVDVTDGLGKVVVSQKKKVALLR